MTQTNTTQLAKEIRQQIVRMIAKSGSSHVGCCLSIVDILAVLYNDVMQYDITDPAQPGRDRFLLSKGHAAAALYATLAEKGFFPRSWLDTYNKHGAKLLGHSTAKGVPGVEVSTGALGHGLPIGLGMAKALKIDQQAARVYVLVGDGECNEGSIWEAAQLAPQLQLNNLCMIVDYNKIQSLGAVKDVIDLEPFTDKWKSTGWHVQRVDGHDCAALHAAFGHTDNNKPSVIIADTVKGKGVSYMENQLAWHYKCPNEQQLAQALEELGAVV